MIPSGIVNAKTAAPSKQCESKRLGPGSVNPFGRNLIRPAITRVTPIANNRYPNLGPEVGLPFLPSKADSSTDPLVTHARKGKHIKPTPQIIVIAEKTWRFVSLSDFIPLLGLGIPSVRGESNNGICETVNDSPAGPRNSSSTTFSVFEYWQPAHDKAYEV